MKYIFLTLVTLIFIPTSWATTTNPTLNKVASKYAQRHITVLCHASGEDGDPLVYGAWGYVFLWDNKAYLSQEVCEGAIGIITDNPAVPLWKKALGALVLTHESYHLRLNLKDRRNEATTQCRAIRHFKYTVRFLGGSQKLADELLPYALTFYWKLAKEVPEYYTAKCNVPMVMDLE